MLDALRAVGAGIDRYRQVVAARLGLGTAELIAISHLHHQEGLRAAQIGARTGLTPGSVTALLDRLESRGYVTRLRPDHDRRTLQIHLTPAGRAIGDAMVGSLVPALDTISRDIGTDGSRTVITVLNQITEVLTGLHVDQAAEAPDQPRQQAGHRTARPRQPEKAQAGPGSRAAVGAETVTGPPTRC
jgi:DNA-binding MarR family transcriptional regulator